MDYKKLYKEIAENIEFLPEIDVAKPKSIKIRDDGSVVWINVAGVCLFRACQIENLILIDERNIVK
jgi:hypothetical protein